MSADFGAGPDRNRATDPMSDRILESVLSGTRREELDRAASQRQRRHVQVAAALLVVAGSAGMWAVAARDQRPADLADSTQVDSAGTFPSSSVGTISATPPAETVVQPSDVSAPDLGSTPCNGGPQSGNSNSAAGGGSTGASEARCANLAIALNTSINSLCTAADTASGVAQQQLDVVGLEDWTVDVAGAFETSADQCALAWVRPETKSVVVESDWPHCDQIDDGLDCRTISTSLRTDIHSLCLTPDEAVDAAVDTLARLDVSDWSTVVTGGELCNLAWVDSLTSSITLGDRPPS